MYHFRVDADTAFALLEAASMKSNHRLADLAAQLTGAANTADHGPAVRLADFPARPRLLTSIGGR